MYIVILANYFIGIWKPFFSLYSGYFGLLLVDDLILAAMKGKFLGDNKWSLEFHNIYSETCL